MQISLSIAWEKWAIEIYLSIFVFSYSQHASQLLLSGYIQNLKTGSNSRGEIRWIFIRKKNGQIKGMMMLILLHNTSQTQCLYKFQNPPK